MVGQKKKSPIALWNAGAVCTGGKTSSGKGAAGEMWYLCGPCIAVRGPLCVWFFAVLSYVTVAVAAPTDVGNSGEARHEGLGRQ